ncbi:MAG: response regulator transcription factor [Acidimicrobiia bacterium]|nr:response regulator transcription factor [Acidimicrobiia bacterium]
MTSNSTVRVLIVDDHEVVRTGLRTIISLHDSIEVVGEATNGHSAIDQCAAVRPNLVLMDMKMPGMDGPTTIARMRALFPGLKILVLTAFDEPQLVGRALAAGAVGYLLKDTEEDELIAAIQLAAAGYGAGAPATSPSLVKDSREAPGEEYRASVTAREMDVLRLVASGLTNPQISKRLSISVSTVNHHVHNLLNKLGAKTRTEAVAIALREGLVDL